MARRPKKTNTQPARVASDSPRGTKTAAVQAALDAHPEKTPKEIADMLSAEGWDIKGQYVSTVKAKKKGVRKGKKVVARAPRKTAPAARKSAEAIALDSLKKAKQLAAQLGGIDQAKAALAALSELVD